MFKSSAFDYQFLGGTAPYTIIHKILSRLMEYGFKTAIEIMLIATHTGAIQIEQEVNAVAGT